MVQQFTITPLTSSEIGSRMRGKILKMKKMMGVVMGVMNYG
jgi:hypothetical protein